MKRGSAYITRPEDMALAIARLQVAGQHHHVELFRAAHIGEVAVTMVIDPRTSIRDALAFHRAVDKPMVMVIGGDTDPSPPSRDATGWRCARGAIGWAKAVMVHGTGIDPEPYRAAIVLALEFKRLLLVECCSAHVDSWTRLVPPGTPGCIILPPPGAVHPDPSRRGPMH